MTTFNKPEFNSVWASGGTKTSPEPAKINQGWVVEIPPFEYDNWVRNRQDAMLAHINQAGIVAWDASVEYQAGKSYVQSPSGVVFKALTTHTGVNPDTDVNGNWEVAFQRSGEALLKAQNLADVPDKAQARTNLGIATTADYDSRYLRQVQNLADLPSKPTARGNLGLGDSSTRNVGTVSGTVAAGDDSRIVNAVPNERSIVAGNGLTGGGNLAADRTISLGVPSAITATSGNSVSASTHTHTIDVASLFPFQRSNTTSLSIGGLIFKTGVSPNIGDGGSVYITFSTPFPSTCINIQATQNSGVTSSAQASHLVVTDISRTGFRLHYNSTVSVSATVMYLAIGY